MSDTIRNGLLLVILVLFLAVMLQIVTAYNQNNGVGLLESQMRLAQAYPTQVTQIQSLANANATNANAEVARAQAQSTIMWSVIVAFAIFMVGVTVAVKL